MKLILARNSTSISVTIFIQDPDSPSGEGKADLTYADINAAYYKSGSSVYEVMTLQSTTLGEWISGGFVELENYNPDPSGGEYMKGVYQLCLPDDVLADDSSTIADNSVVVMLTSGSTDIVPCILEIQLIEQDLGDVNVTKWNSNTEPVTDFEASMSTAIIGEAIAGTLSNTQMTTDLDSTQDDYYNGRVVIWTSGNLHYVARAITDYAQVNKMVTYAALPGALTPTAGDTFVII